MQRLAGLDVPEDEIVRILESLGFEFVSHEPMEVAPPSWRSDIHGPADLVEEVVRIYGLDKVPSIPMRRPHAVARPVLTPEQKKRRLVRRTLAARGFSETISYSFIARAQAKLFGGGDDARQLENPIASDLDALRPSVLPSLLAAASRNLARGFAISNCPKSARNSKAACRARRRMSPRAFASAPACAPGRRPPIPPMRSTPRPT